MLSRSYNEVINRVYLRILIQTNVSRYNDIDLFNIGSGNGLLRYGTEALPEPMLINHQWSLLALPHMG